MHIRYNWNQETEANILVLIIGTQITANLQGGWNYAADFIFEKTAA